MISERLEELVEDMVDKGVHFEDAVREFEKRFIARVLSSCDGSLTKTADTLGRMIGDRLQARRRVHQIADDHPFGLRSGVH